LIEVLLLPDRKRVVVPWDRARVQDLLKLLDGDDLDSLAVVVNGKLVETVDYEIKSGDDVIIIKQATGG